MASRLLTPEIAIFGTEKQLFFRLLFQILLPLHHDIGKRREESFRQQEEKVKMEQNKKELLM